MAPKPRYADGEKVLCFHGPLLYEAKCLKSQLKDKHMKYFIHYSGWNKNWDEWVPECRVLKYNEVNLQKQKELEKMHMKSKKSKSVKAASIRKETEKELVQPVPTVSSQPKPKTEKKVVPTPPVPEQPVDTQCEIKKKKPRLDLTFMAEVKGEMEIKIDIPSVLKSWLIDDWDLITRQKMILQLPARITVDHIIASYVKEKVSVKGLSHTKETAIVQIANKIRDCFNVLLGKMLLYKFERPQYAEMLAEYHDLHMCQLYGAIHLLRMFTKLGNMLTPGNTSEKGLTFLLEHLSDFTKYMSLNKNFFSLSDYVVPSPEYHRRAL